MIILKYFEVHENVNFFHSFPAKLVLSPVFSMAAIEFILNLSKN